MADHPAIPANESAVGEFDGQSMEHRAILPRRRSLGPLSIHIREHEVPIPSTTRFIFGPDTKPLRRVVNVIVTCVRKVDADIHREGNTTTLPISIHPTIASLQIPIFFRVLYYPKNTRDSDSSQSGGRNNGFAQRSLLLLCT